MSKGTPIVLGDNSLTDSMGKGRIDLDHGKLNNVLYIPGLSFNLLSVYHMTHTGSPKKVIFSPDDVEIIEISNGKVIAKGVVDHTSNVYKFPIFYPTQTPLLFLLILMNQAIFGMKYLAILTTSIFLI